MKKNIMHIYALLSIHACAPVQIYRGVTIRVRGWKEVGAASYRTMNAVLLLWVTTDSLSVATEEETAATCGHLVQRHGPNHGGAVRKLLFNDGRLGH